MKELLKLHKINLNQIKEYENNLNNWKKDIIAELILNEKLKLKNLKIIGSDSSLIVEVIDNDILVSYLYSVYDDTYDQIEESIWINIPIPGIIQLLNFLSFRNKNKLKEFIKFLNNYLELLKDCILTEIYLLHEDYKKLRYVYEEKERVGDNYFRVIDLIVVNDYDIYVDIQKTDRNYKIYPVKFEELSLTMINNIINSLKVKISQ